MTDIGAYREKRALDNDRLMTKRALEHQRKLMADGLLGEMGKDIENVLSGKVKVRLSFWEKFRYKVKFIVNKFFNTF